MEANDIIDSILGDELKRNVLRYACSRAISCGCGRVLDCRSAVSWAWRPATPAGLVAQEFVACGQCFDRVRGASGEAIAYFDATAAEVYDGRKLWVLAPKRPAQPPKRNVARQADLHAGQRVVVRVSGRDSTVKILGTRTRTIYGSRSGVNSTRQYFVGVNERTGRDVKFTAAKVRQILLDSPSS